MRVGVICVEPRWDAMFVLKIMLNCSLVVQSLIRTILIVMQNYIASYEAMITFNWNKSGISSCPNPHIF